VPGAGIGQDQAPALAAIWSIGSLQAAVDGDGDVYEAKTKPPDTVYHGYRIGEDEPQMRRYILGEWTTRCP
jgi:hypothetical protein